MPKHGINNRPVGADGPGRPTLPLRARRIGLNMNRA